MVVPCGDTKESNLYYTVPCTKLCYTGHNISKAKIYAARIIICRFGYIFDRNIDLVLSSRWATVQERCDYFTAVSCLRLFLDNTHADITDNILMTGDLSHDTRLSNSYDVDMPPDSSEALKRTLLSVTIVPSGTIPKWNPDDYRYDRFSICLWSYGTCTVLVETVYCRAAWKNSVATERFNSFVADCFTLYLKSINMKQFMSNTDLVSMMQYPMPTGYWYHFCIIFQVEHCSISSVVLIRGGHWCVSGWYHQRYSYCWWFLLTTHEQESSDLCQTFYFLWHLKI